MLISTVPSDPPLDENEKGCWVSENGERSTTIHAYWPGRNRKPRCPSGRSVSEVVSPRSGVTRSMVHGRLRSVSGLPIRTHTRRVTNAADMTTHNACFQRELM